MPNNIWTVVPFHRAFRDMLNASGTAFNAFRENLPAHNGKSHRLRDNFLALRTPLETVRLGHTRLADDKPLSCIIPVQHRSRGASETSETRKTLTTRYAVLLANILDVMKKAGLNQAQREGRLQEALRTKGLWPTQVRFDVAQRIRREYRKQWGLQAAEVKKRQPCRDRNGRILLERSEEKAVDKCLDLLKILEIAILRAIEFDLGRNSLESANIKKGKLPTPKRIAEELLGTERAQVAQHLTPSDFLNIGIQGHVNPALFSLDMLSYADLFDLAVFMGQAVAGHVPDCNAAIAATYLADVKRSWSPKPCDLRAVQDRDWYARELRECLEKPAYAPAKAALEHAIETIPESDMRATIPQDGDKVLYVLA